MNKNKIIFSSLLAVVCAMQAVGCASAKKEEYTFKNSGFERGTLSAWETHGEAFTEDGVVFDSKDAQGNLYNYKGEFFFCGYKSAPEYDTGYMLSEPFKLEGNGKIGFLIGAGANTAKCYVALVNEKNTTEYATRANDEFEEGIITNGLHRVILDGSDYVGKTVRVKVVDNDAGEGYYNYINVDDFIVNYQGEEDAVGKLADANRYVAENKDKVNKKYRMSYHLMPEIGWCNDPNGFVFYEGKIHQFYQHNPYSTAWGPMHWGHATSTDFVKWEYLPIALAPDTPYDEGSGCFSGSAIEKDGKLYLMYTGVAKDGRQQQCLVESSNGVTFEKVNRNPVINSSMVAPGLSTIDFRDPYVYKNGDTYYCIVGAKEGSYGQLVLYKSTTLKSWDYVGKVMNCSDPSAPNFYQLSPGIYECPTYAVIDGQPILICSPQFLPQKGNQFENVHSVVYMAGNFNYSTGRFIYDEMREVDGGFDFYAAQLMNMPDGRVVMTAWMQMWDRVFPTQADGWCGAMILPRELSYKNGRLYQSPVKEIENYRANKVESGSFLLASESKAVEGIAGDTLELEVKIQVGNASKTGVKVFKGSEHETLIYYDASSNTVVLDRSNSGKNCKGAEVNYFTRRVDATPIDGVITLRIFLDNTSCEVFINGGESTLTANIYANEDEEGIEFYSENGNATILSATKYDLIIK